MMNKYNILILCSVLLLIIACKKEKPHPLIPSQTKKVKKVHQLTKEQLKNWHFKDIEIDTIPGISLNRAYDSLLVGKKGEEVIVAIIDSEIDINHEDLVERIWLNKNEISNNKIDDDKNGYVDDVHGWNFIGNLKNENIKYSSSELVRIIQKFKKYFKDKDSLLLKNNNDYKTYIAAIKYYDESMKKALASQEYGNFLFTSYPKAKKTLKKLYPKEDYTAEELDSIYQQNKTKNTGLAEDASFLSQFIKYGFSEKLINDNKKKQIIKSINP